MKLFYLLAVVHSLYVSVVCVGVGGCLCVWVCVCVCGCVSVCGCVGGCGWVGVCVWVCGCVSAHKILISLVASFFLMPDLHADIQKVYICTFFSPGMCAVTRASPYLHVAVIVQ